MRSHLTVSGTIRDTFGPKLQFSPKDVTMAVIQTGRQVDTLRPLGEGCLMIIISARMDSVTLSKSGWTGKKWAGPFSS